MKKNEEWWSEGFDDGYVIGFILKMLGNKYTYVDEGEDKRVKEYNTGNGKGCTNGYGRELDERCINAQQWGNKRLDVNNALTKQINYYINNIVSNW